MRAERLWAVLDDYEQWIDSYLGRPVAQAPRALYTFGRRHALFEALAARRASSAQARTYFACHAARAAAAEATQPSRRGNIIQVR